MRRLIWIGFLFLGFLVRLPAADSAASPLAGTWRFVPDRSTVLSAWGALKLVIKVDGPHVTIERYYEAGRRNYTEVTALDLSKEVNRVPFDWWPDNRHIGAYSGGDHTKVIRAQLRDGGRRLRVDADFTLATQQGDHPVNVLSDYKVSANGTQLTLVELRSTRNDPIEYIFRRVTDAAADEAVSKGRAE